MRATRTDGFALAPLMALLMVVLGMIFLVAAICQYQTALASHADTHDQALYLAEGALSQAMAQLHAGMQAGHTQYGRAKQVTTYAPYSARPDAQGQVSFDPACPWGYSTNNYDGTQNVGYDNVPVPSNMVHIISQGVYGSSSQRLEAFVQIPTYNYVIACDGPLQAVGGLKAYAATSMAIFATNTENGTPDTTSPANVGASGNITAGPGTVVTGDIVSPSTVSLTPPATVNGAVLNGQVDIPGILVRNYNNQATAATMGPTAPIDAKTNACRILKDTYAGNGLTVNGDLEVDNTTLYVNGSLTVRGALRGSGVVCVDGPATIKAGADINALDVVALLATGDVNMLGGGKYFQGLIYSEGAFTADSLTVVGTLLAKNAGEGTGSPCAINLTNTTVVWVPDVTVIGPAASISVSSLPGIWTAGINGVPDFLEGLDPTSSTAEARAWQAVLAALQSTPDGKQFLQELGNSPSLTMFSNGPSVPGPISPVLLAAEFYNPSTNQFATNVVPPPSYLAFTSGSASANQGQPMFDGYLAAYDASASSTGMLSAPQVWACMQTAAVAAGTELNQYLTPTSGPGHTVPNLNLNQFLTDQIPLRVVSWRQL